MSDGASRPLLSAGWLLADLMLAFGLFVGFDAVVAGSAPGAAGTARTTSTTAPGPGTTTPSGIERTAICFRFENVPAEALEADVVDGPALGALPEQVATFLRETGIESRQVGLVLTFAHGPEGTAALEHQRQVADGFNRVVTHRFGPFAGALTKYFSYSDGQTGVVTGEVYLDAAAGPVVDPRAGGFTPDDPANCHATR